jgi:hypothetical protein
MMKYKAYALLATSVLVNIALSGWAIFQTTDKSTAAMNITEWPNITQLPV